MRLVAVLFSLVMAWVIAFRLVGFTSAVQAQKTILVGLVLSALFSGFTYGIVRRKRTSKR
jgi:ABC-type Fe3+-siderophore transport system permease subunit